MMGEGTVNDEELVEVIERTIDDYFYASDMPIAERIAVALRSAGFQVFKPEDVRRVMVWEYESMADDIFDDPDGAYFLVPADSGGSG